MSGTALASVLALSVAFGISPYATVAALGFAYRFGWLASLPPHLHAVANPWLLTVAAALTAVEFAATLLPGVASAWEAVHAAIRPPAAVLMAALVVWGADPAVVIAVGLLSGSVAFGTSLTKLGARLAIDTSPEPVSNGAASIGELSFVAIVSVFAIQHPFMAACGALVTVATTALLVRAVWGMIWRTVVRSRRPGVGSLRS